MVIGYPINAQHSWLATYVMEDLHKALTNTSEHTDSVYLDPPKGTLTINPWISKQQHCILPQSYQVLVLTYSHGIFFPRLSSCHG